MVNLELTDLERRLAEMIPPDACPIADKILHPSWEECADEWVEQIPKSLRMIWDNLSLESKLVAYIVGACGIRPWDIE
jgi:hypothetical protein